MLTIPKGTPYYYLSPNEDNLFRLSYHGLMNFDQDQLVFEENYQLFKQSTIDINEGDKIMFSKNVKFPILSINRLGDLKIKKVDNNPNKIIVDLDNQNIIWGGYIIQYNNIYYQIPKYLMPNNIARKIHTYYSETKYPGIKIYKYYKINKVESNLITLVENNSDKLVSFYDFFNYYLDHRPKLTKDFWDSIQAMLQSDTTNIKLAAELLIQYDYRKYLADLISICSNHNIVNTLKSTKSGSAVIYTCFFHHQFYHSITVDNPFINKYHKLRFQILSMNKTVSEEYKIQL